MSPPTMDIVRFFFFPIFKDGASVPLPQGRSFADARHFFGNFAAFAALENALLSFGLL